MGLIKMALGASVGSVLSDQWKEYFYCEAMSDTVLATRGVRKNTGRGVNRGNDNIISSGSIVAVADGQCMLIVEQGKVVEVCAEPGEFRFDASTEPSILAGGLRLENLKAVFATVGKRFVFGGEIPKDQRVYYFNTKELIGNRYGTPTPVPFRVVDQRAGIDIDISLRCYGEYSYKISNPLLFYTNVCGNMAETYMRDAIDSQLRTELLTALQPAFGRLSSQGIRYSALPAHTKELSRALNDELSAEWRDIRGLEVVSFGISSVSADEEDAQMIKEMQRTAAYRDPGLGAAVLVGARADAMKAAARNEGGAMNGFIGMGMAQGMGGMDVQGLYQMAQPSSQPIPASAGPGVAPSSDSWTCSCGAVANGSFCFKCGSRKPEPKPASFAGENWTCPGCGNSAIGNFCPNCGSKKPEPKPADDGSWTCPACGGIVGGNFCPQCGTARPAKEDGWTCPGCGTKNKGRFCFQCGTPKPAGVPQYRCDKCGWEPDDPTKPPQFCPQCGDPFGDEDTVR